MIGLVIILLIVFYVIVTYSTSKKVMQAIIDYARMVDDVFLEKDKKIEDLECRLSDMQFRIENLENNLPKNEPHYNFPI